MNYDEAMAWLRGERSTNNQMMEVEGDEPRTFTLAQIAVADAAMTTQAFYVVKAHNMGLVYANMRSH